jgi:hypothetical protein
MRALRLVVYAILLVDVCLFVLSFVPWFSGVNRKFNAGPGVADHLFGSRTVGGWRGDVVWMVGSTLLLAVAFIFLSLNRSGEASGGRILKLCGAWIIVVFPIYMAWVVMHMMG